MGMSRVGRESGRGQQRSPPLCLCLPRHSEPVTERQVKGAEVLILAVGVLIPLLPAKDEYLYAISFCTFISPVSKVPKGGIAGGAIIMS